MTERETLIAELEYSIRGLWATNGYARALTVAQVQRVLAALASGGAADIERLRAQAVEISVLLSEAGIGSSTLPVGVRTLIQQRDELRLASGGASPAPDHAQEKTE